MLLLALLCWFAVGAQARVQYTKVSFTKNNHHHCASDCEPGHKDKHKHFCITKQSGKTEECVPGHDRAWVYHTYQVQSSSRFCVSRCGSFDQPYDWCFVKDTAWDYCNPDESFYMERKVVTDLGIPCKTHCEQKDGHRYHKCTDIFGDVEKCQPDHLDYVRAATRDSHGHHGHCETPCKQGRGDHHASCFVSKGNKEHCAAPARNYYELQHLMHEFKRHVEHRGVHPPEVPSHLISDHIHNLKNADGLIKHTVDEQHNSIHSYYMIPAYYYDEPFLPLAVEATINHHKLPRHARSQNDISRRADINVRLLGKNTRLNHNNDENGHLIAFSLGGPRHLYNFAPQTAELNRGILKPAKNGKERDWWNSYDFSAWYGFEREIKAVVTSKKEPSIVDLTVAVVYEELKRPGRHSIRPVGFAVSQDRYKPNQKLPYYYVHDAFFSNDPRSGISG